MLARTGIYVHLPFCPYVCPYCDFAKWAYAPQRAERYLQALRAEIDAAPEVRGATIFFGGGTPNTYPASTIAALIEALRARFAIPPDGEISVEINPDPGLCEELPALRAAGVNRLSIGVQSFAPNELRALGRRHTARDAETVVARARAAGFANVSIDLMFGVPGQSEASWRDSLERALALGIDHLSTYGLTIEADTPYAKWFARDPAAFFDDDREARLYAIAIERAARAGFEHYEISNFARPGYRCAHNANYWRNGSYVGLGVGAASYIDGVRSTHTRDLETYCSSALAGTAVPGESERLVGDERTGEATMLALRTLEGVDTREFRERYDVDFHVRYRTVIADLTAAGMLHVAGERVQLTERGRYLANDVCGAFLGGR
ncbi:MAG: radical SAM family heme chaperone HemW [Candidatus Velthaea sp.]|jgi:oxygen-independent coproporphyrinogen-3 oxidase